MELLAGASFRATELPLAMEPNGRLASFPSVTPAGAETLRCLPSISTGGALAQGVPAVLHMLVAQGADSVMLLLACSNRTICRVELQRAVPRHTASLLYSTGVQPLL